MTQEVVHTYDLDSYTPELQPGIWAVTLRDTDGNTTYSANINTNTSVQDAENYFGSDATESENDLLCCTFSMTTKNINTPVAFQEIDFRDDDKTISFPVYQEEPGLIPFQPQDPRVKIRIRLQNAETFNVWKNTVLYNPSEDVMLPYDPDEDETKFEPEDQCRIRLRV